MAKRDNPRLREQMGSGGSKNKRNAHTIGKSGRLEKNSSGRYGRGENKSEYRGERKERRSFENRDERPRRSFRDEEDFEMNPNLIIGRNPVTEALKSGRSIDKVLIQKDAEGSANKIASLARERKLNIQYVDKIVLDKMCPGRPHQGVAAFGAAHSYADMDDIFTNAAAAGEDPLIMILDGLEDPHNLGAVIRSCDGAGAHGVIIPARRAVGLTETVAKTSAGAIEYVPVVKETNLNQTVEELKERGVWLAAVDMDGVPYDKADLSGPLALVVGGEGQGVSRLLKEKCDFVVSIPMKGHVNSLNASNAAAILLYEALRQRNAKKDE